MNPTSVNFGALKDTIYNISYKQLVKESKVDISSDVLRTFVNEMRENPILKIQFLVYKNLESGYYKKETLAERYINQNLKLIENFEWNEILNTNKRIRHKLLEDVHVEGAEGKDKLYESIHTLIKSVTQKGYRELDKSQDAYDYLLEYLMKDKSTSPDINENAESEKDEYPKILSWQFVTNMAVNRFNERYAHLNENEKQLVKMLLSPEQTKKNHFLDLKNENLTKINDILFSDKTDNSIRETVMKFKSKIESLDENKLSQAEIDESLINLMELKESLVENSAPIAE